VTAADSLTLHSRPPRTTASREAGAEGRPRGRPRGGVLNASKITAASFTLIAQSGYQGLTMAALARTLNVAKSALYNHVASKQDILRLLEEHLISQVDVSAFGTAQWDDAIQRWALSYRNVFAKHTPLIPLIAVLPVAGAPKTLAMYEKVSTGLLEAGFAEDHIVSVIVALEAFIFGSAFDVNAPDGIFNPGRLAAAAPRFTSVVAHLNDSNCNELPADTAFGLGLKAFVRGLRQLRTELV
jgi:AcrR family transcriptional regulator